jgi:hypothetical protein
MFIKNGVQNSTYLSLFYSVISFGGIVTLIKRGNNDFAALFLISISIGYLATFIEKKAKNRKQKIAFLFLSYAVPTIMLLYGLIFKLI